MTDRDPATEPRSRSGRLLYPLAALLVIAYVNTFELWAVLVESIGAGRAALVPFAALASALVLAGGWIVVGRRDIRINPVLLIAGLALALLGLALTDPEYPAKRIHVPQYFLLALVLRRALSDHLGGAPLTAATVVITLIFGIHDEMLQGLHPSRTYGLRDMAVNGTAGAAGALMAAGVGLRRGASGPFHLPLVIGAALAFQLAALAYLVLGLATGWGGLPDVPPPVWAGTPVLPGGFALMVLVRAGSPCSGIRHLCRVIVWITLPFVLYPVIPHVTPLVFR
jgi:hypothetical protein